MEAELAFFLSLNGLVSDSLIQDLHEEHARRRPRPDSHTKKVTQQRQAKLTTAIMQAAAESDSESESPADDVPVPVSEESDAAAPGLQFSKIHVATAPDLKQKKGKNKYQKLRESLYKEKQEAENPVASTWAKVRNAAAGGKVEASSVQLAKSIKREKQEKRKKFEKKMDKQAKEQKKEAKEKAGKEGKFSKGKGKSFGQGKPRHGKGDKGGKSKRPNMKKH
jgi:hypothetical protein